MPNDALPDWETVLSAAARLQTILPEYRNLDPRWHDWNAIRAACEDRATLIFDRITGLEE